MSTLHTTFTVRYVPHGMLDTCMSTCTYRRRAGLGLIHYATEEVIHLERHQDNALIGAMCEWRVSVSTGIVGNVIPVERGWRRKLEMVICGHFRWLAGEWLNIHVSSGEGVALVVRTI